MTEQQLINDGYRKYTGEKINVFFNATVCAHAAECVRGNSDVFNTKRKPWIVADAAHLVHSNTFEKRNHNANND